MALLAKELVGVQPKNRVVTDGVAALVNDGDPFTIWGSVQPAPAALVEQLEEGARKSAKWVVYTEGPTVPFELLPAHPAVTPRLSTTKGILVPLAVIDHTLDFPTAVLSNAAYICAEEAADEPST